MEVLSRQSRFALFGCCLWVTGWCLFAQGPAQEVVGMPGLEVEVIYQDDGTGPAAMNLAQDMAIDPLTGDLYIAQAGANDAIISLNFNTMQMTRFGFNSLGLAFGPDGTLYFGVSDFILGAWFRESGAIRKFAIIPAINGVEFDQTGRLLVGEGSFGPTGLFTDAILEVDTGDGFFQPVFETSAAVAAIGNEYSVLTSIAVDLAGNLYAGYNSGLMVKKRVNGEYTQLNTRPIRISGLNKFSLTHADGLVFQYDSGSGQLFAIDENEEVTVLAFGDALRGAGTSENGMTADGDAVFFAGDRNQLWRVRAVGGGGLRPVVNADRGRGTVSGRISVLFSEDPLAEASIRFQTGEMVQTGADGSFSIDLKAGLYEVVISKVDFADAVLNIVVNPGETTTLNYPLNPGLPERLAPGLGAEVVARHPADPTLGTSDVVFDSDGNFYSMNFGNATVSKHILDPETREHLRSYVFAQGGNLGNSFVVAVDAAHNVYASTGNDGVLMLPPRGDETAYVLTSDASDPTIVRDQDGVNRVISKVRDVDGIAVRGDGSLVFSSGAGGSPIPGLPEGTFNSLVDHRNGVETIFSRGVPPGASASVFSNNDILKIDEQGRLMVGTGIGNVVRIDPNAVVELIWPGDGAGKPDGAGAFTGLNSDGNGNLFLRGLTGDGSDNTLRMITPDGNNLITVAAGMRQCFGGFAFDRDGRDVYVSEGGLIIRIFTQDGRTIADNLLDPPPAPEPVDENNYRKMVQTEGFLPHPEMN